MVTATLLTLGVIPAIYVLWHDWQLRRSEAPDSGDIGPGDPREDPFT